MVTAVIVLIVLIDFLKKIDHILNIIKKYVFHWKPAEVIAALVNNILQDAGKPNAKIVVGLGFPLAKVCLIESLALLVILQTPESDKLVGVSECSYRLSGLSRFLREAAL